MMGFSKLIQRQGLKKILANSGWMMGEQIIRMLVGLFVAVWIARHLGPSQFGQLSFAIAYASIFGIFVTLGLNRIMVRELVKHAADAVYTTGLLSTVLAMRLVAAGGMFVLCTLLAWFAEQGELILVGIISAGFFFSTFDCIELFFQARVEARVVVIARSFAFFLITFVKIALLIDGAGLVAFAWVTLAECALSALAFWVVYRQRGFQVNSTGVDWQLARRLLGESWPEIIAGFSAMFLMKMDQVMLQNMMGSETVGIYSVAARLSEAWYFVPYALVASTFPNIIKQREVDSQSYMNRIQLLMLGLVALSYVAILLTNFLAEPIILALYGVAYHESAEILIVHIWCGLFVSLGISSGSWIMAEKKVKLNLYRTLLGAVTNLILNLLFIPHYGAIGAAYATLISLMVAYVLFDFFVPSMRSMAKAKIKALLLYRR